MDGRRNFSPDPDAEPRWYPDDRGYDERGRDDRRDERLDDRRDDRSRDDRAYGDDRGYTPTRYADDREYDDGYRVPEPRGAARGYGDPLAYGDSPSGQFSPPLPPPPAAPGAGPESVDLAAESVSRSRRSEAIDRSALQRPVSGGAPGAPSAQLPPPPPPPPVTVPTAPQAGFAQQHAFAAPTTLTAAVPSPSPAAEPGGAVYRSKRPGLAVALVVLTVVFELPVLRLFLTAVTADKIEAAGTLASIFMILGLPMFALGLYGLIGGAAASAPGVRAWSRTPLAYLPIAVLLFLAAALST